MLAPARLPVLETHQLFTPSAIIRASALVCKAAQPTSMVSTDLSYLPDASEELATSADLTVTVQDTTLLLHSQVLTTGSRVLRTALLSTGGGSGACDAAADWGAAVERAFLGHELKDVSTFLKLLYSQVAVKGMGTGIADIKGVIELAHKLDAPSVLQASLDGRCGIRCPPLHASWKMPSG